MLGIPEELYTLFENSVTKEKVTNRIRLRDFVQSRLIDGKMVVVRREKFLEEMLPETMSFTGYALNLIVDLLGSGYDYLGYVGDSHVLHRPEFYVDPALLPTGSDPIVPENFIYITTRADGETIRYEINEVESFREVVKLRTGEWIVKKEWTRAELLSLKFKSLEQPKILMPSAYDKLPTIPPAKFDDSRDVDVRAVNSADPNVIRHMFTAIYTEGDPNVLKSEIYMNGKTDSEKPFASYTSSGNGLTNHNAYDCAWALFNDYPIPTDGSDPNGVLEIGNFGMVTRQYFSKTDPKSKSINLVADGQRKYDAATHTFHYDPTKPVVVQFRTNHFPKNGKEVRHESYFNPLTGKLSYNMLDI